MEISQDPGSIEHEQAPTGDFYAMPQQKGKKKGKNQVSSADPESADVAAMYSTVDTSKKKNQVSMHTSIKNDFLKNLGLVH